MAKPSITGKTVDTVLELTGKFTENFVKAIVGKRSSATKQKDVSFDGKAKIKKDGKDTASKIKPLKQGNQFIDALSKIYNFMNKNYEEDKLHRERLENFKEEEKLEADKRHKALLAQIDLMMKDRNDGKQPTASKVENESGMSLEGIVGSILNAFGGARTAISVLSTLGGFVASPLGVALIGAVVAGTVGAWMYKQIKADPQAALEGKGGIGMAVAGLGSEGQLPSAEETTANRDLEAKAKEVDKKGIKKATLEELQAKLDLEMDYGHAKSPLVAELKKEISLRQSEPSSNPQTPAPAAPPAAVPPPASPAGNASSSVTPVSSTQASVDKSLSPGESVMPAPMTPASAKLNTVQAENNNAKVSALTEPSTSTINNITSSQVSKKSSSEVRSKIPPVRNLEETFQKMITYSTRVV
jgi:hypothetical protein